MDTKQAFDLGYERGLRRGQEGPKFPDGVDWHIIGTRCGCGHEVIPVADNAGEDINLYEKMGELRAEKCDGCGKFKKVFYEDGNMASKKKHG